MAFTIDMSGLLSIESAVVALQAQQAAAPTTFTGGAPFSVKGLGAGAPSTMTTAQLVQRLQALLLAAQSLPL